MKLRKLLIATTLFLLIMGAGSSHAGIIIGNITDYETGQPIENVSIRIEGTGQSSLGNENGQYRIRLEPGDYTIKFSHIAHYSEKIDINVGDSSMNIDLQLRPSMLILKPLRVYERKYDPGQRIIVEAISRKDDILSKIHDYSFSAYAKMIVSDTSKPDTTEIMFIAESQLKYFWEKPDKYKEIILARKQTANLKGENVILGVGGIINLNQNRIDFAEYSVVSPTADDALDFYNYYLLDTIYIDSQAVFRLEVEPKTNSSPLFEGIIDIADSTYNVVGIDVGFNDMVTLQFVDSLRITQTFDRFEDNYWMPIRQGLTGIVDVSFPGIPIMRIDYLASIHSYTFDTDLPDTTFGEYALIVSEKADDYDSTSWLTNQLVPLTEKQLSAYHRIDSTVNKPSSLGAKFLKLVGGALAVTLFAPDFFHFNRVDGYYLGAAIKKRDIFNAFDIYLKGGYAFDGKNWQQRYVLDYHVWDKKKLKIGFDYHDELVSRPALVIRSPYNPTIRSVLIKVDPLQYYLEKGFSTRLSMRPLRKIDISFFYNDYNQNSVTNNTDFGIMADDDEHEENQAITNGKLRSISGRLTIDTRRLMLNKKRELKMTELPYLITNFEAEYADQNMINNDFNFTRYNVSIEINSRVLGLGRGSLFIYGGLSKRNLPPQRFYAINYTSFLMSYYCNIKTMGQEIFMGSRVGLISYEHYFGKTLYRKSGLPLIKSIPFPLSIHAAIFWTDFKGHPDPPDAENILMARKPYSEIGFGLGGIIPMGMEMTFSWQVSEYKTEMFTIRLDGSF